MERKGNKLIVKLSEMPIVCTHEWSYQRITESVKIVAEDIVMGIE